MRLPVHELEPAQVWILGVIIICLAAAVVFGGQWVWRAKGKPDWIVDSSFLAFSRWLFASGVILILAVSWPADGKMVLALSYRRTAAFVTAAIILAAVLIIFGRH